jgi:hypothetical protein
MQDQPKREGTNAAQDRHDQGIVLVHVVTQYPIHFRLSDLVRELTDGSDFGERDGIERAVGDLIRVGLLFRCDGLVLPTRAALRAYEVLEDEPDAAATL